MTDRDKYLALYEVRAEISRVNRLAGEPVFNPAAIDLLNEVIADLEAALA